MRISGLYFGEKEFNNKHFSKGTHENTLPSIHIWCFGESW